MVYEACGEILVDEPRLVEKMRVIEDESLDEVKRLVLPLAYGQVPTRTKVVGRGKQARTIAEPNDPVDVARVQVVAAKRLVEVSESRRKLYGMDAPQKVALTDPTGERRYGELTDDELTRLLQQKVALLGAGQ